MSNLTVERFMTRAPHTIEHDESLMAAHRVLRRHNIRHLPVLKAGKLVGLVSQRDLHLIESLKDVDPDEVTVGEAMSTELYCAEPRTRLQDVVAEMMAHKYGAAVIVEGGAVAGMFTTHDALGALFGVLESSSEQPGASSTRKS